MMTLIKFGTILFTALIAIHNTASAVEFNECTKFKNTDKDKYLQCARYSFSEATQKGEYQKARQWLSGNRGEQTHVYSQLLTTLMCESPTVKGGRPFKGSKQGVIQLSNDLLNLGASYSAMPIDYLVTPLFCVVNRQDSVVLDQVLTRIKVSSKDLNTSQYEGVYSDYVPLYRAILNNDLASAKVLVKHGASPEAVAIDSETTLRKALELGYIKIANWLLDVGASVNVRKGENGCVGKPALDYALAMPANVSGKDQIITRIKAAMQKLREMGVHEC